MLTQKLGELRVIGVLVFAAKDQVNWMVERGDSLGGGVDVGGFRIVEELDAVDCGYVFKAMLNGFEFLDSATDGVGSCSCKPRSADRSKNVLDVVLALERNARKRNDPLDGRVFGGAINDMSGFDPCALRHGAIEREPVDTRTGMRGSLRGARVVGIEDNEVLRRLCGEDAFLGASVVLEGPVAVEMIRRDVKNDGDLGMELLGGFELETGHFKNRPGIRRAFIDERNDGDANIAADQRVESSLLENLANQGRRSRLAVGAGDGKRLAPKETRGQFELADDGAAEVARLHQLGRVERNAGTDDDQVLAAEGEQAVAAGLDHDAFVEQRGNVFGQGLGAAYV